MSCNGCVHSGLKAMIDRGAPFGYYGEIPCIGCARHTNSIDRYVESKAPLVDEWYSTDEALKKIKK
jgi:hypothetical protein